MSMGLTMNLIVAHLCYRRHQESLARIEDGHETLLASQEL